MSWERVRELFAACTDRSAAERDLLFASESEEVRREVESLLTADENAGSFLAGRREDHHSRLGAFELISKLGEGGMGTVWEARRADGLFDQRVAIKIVREHFDTNANLDRLSAERQVLARLSHPNICHLLDGGTTAGGLPYFVMERVEGFQIDAFCRERGLSISERLNLIPPICSAVDYAHAQGVLHGDLKPANILVTADGTPKLVDFGIAKTLTGGTTGSATATLLRAASPGYASPEQLMGKPLGPASDIYSLGVTLYELLAGVPALADPPASLPELIHKVAETEPLKPSEAARRAGQAPEICRQLEGDLDNIVLKAIHKEPGLRYHTAAELADDLERHTRGLPVHARGSNRAYRISRFLRRKRTQLAVAVTAFLLGIAVWSGWSHFNTRRYSNRTVAVIGVANQSGDATLDWMSGGVTETISTSLGQSGAFQVISASRVRDVLRQPGAHNTHETARGLHADLFVEGGLSHKADSGRIRLDVRARDTASGSTVFSESFEAASQEAVFTLADQAAAALVARLTTAAPRALDSRTILTKNSEALRVYEEGLEQFGRFNIGAAVARFRKAVELDPEFAVAYSAIAQAAGFANRPAARGAIHRAASLAVARQLSRLDTSIIQGLQMYHDGRLDEAAAMLAVASREFPREGAPLLWLGMAQSYSWRPAEAQTTFAQLVEANPTHALGWLMLSESAGQAGDLDGAARAAAQYCKTIGETAWNCHGLRGDIFAYAERWDEAMAAYRMGAANPEAILKPAVVLWLRGDATEARQEALKEKRSEATAQFILGNIAAASGDWQTAAGHYERSARLYGNPYFAYEQLLKAAEMWLELRRPEKVIEMASRHDNPWLPGLRGLAYLVMGDGASAEAEFSALRASLTPPIGDYLAHRTERHHRMLAAFYRGEHQQVVSAAESLPRRFWTVSALPIGRSLLALGRTGEAREYLEFIWRNRLVLGGPEIFEQSSGLRIALAEFYLGEIAVNQGKDAEARQRLASFLRRFPAGNSGLSQLATARQHLANLH